MNSPAIGDRLERALGNRLTMVLMLLVVMATSAIGTGCFIDGARARQFDNEIGAGIASRDPLVRQAWQMIKQDIEASPAATFTDAKIIRLEKTRSYEAIYPDATVEVYILQYGILVKDPSRVTRVDGAAIEDGWLREQRNTGTPYLVAKRTKGATTVEYLGTIWPDAGCMLDLVCDLKYDLEAQTGAPVARSAIDVRRIFALTSPQPAPEAAAEQLIQRYLDFIRANDQKPIFRNFPFTAYDSVKLAMYPVSEAPADYAVQDWESAEEAWIIEPSLRYRYQLEISAADPTDPDMLRALYEGRYQGDIVQWSALYPGRRIGFLMIKDGDSYTLRSRYFGADGQPR